MVPKKAKLGKDHREITFTLHELGVCLRNKWRYDAADEMLRNALSIESAMVGEDDLQVATTLHELGVLLRWGREDGEEDSGVGESKARRG